MENEYTHIEKYEDSRAYREEYRDGILALMARRAKELEEERRKKVTPESMKENKEAYRAEFKKLLGWPLTEEHPTDVPEVRFFEEPIEGTQAVVRRTKIRLFDELWLYGLLFVPRNMKEGEKLPGVISQHGGLGTPELCSGLTGDSANYNDMTSRVLSYRAVVFAPQLLIWKKEDGEPDFDRPHIDQQLKMMGSSITAIEVFGIMRAIDYLQSRPDVDENRIGMVGLSYGGFYTLHAAAADPRIKSAISSCAYNDCTTFNINDWTFPQAAYTLLDAEIAGLVAPRALVLEAGDHDQLFDPKGAEKEFVFTKAFYAAEGAEDKVLLNVFDGPHELYKGSEDMDFFFANL